MGCETWKNFELVLGGGWGDGSQWGSPREKTCNMSIRELISSWSVFVIFIYFLPTSSFIVFAQRAGFWGLKNKSTSNITAKFEARGHLRMKFISG